MYICKTIASFKLWIRVHIKLSLDNISFKNKEKWTFELLFLTFDEYQHSELFAFFIFRVLFSTDNFSLDAVS